MKRMQNEKIRWGEGILPALVLALFLLLCLLVRMNRLPQKIAAQPVHCVENDLYEVILVDLNAAPKEKLMSLPDIGETLAQRIIDGRPYQSADDLLRVDGIGEATLEELRPLVKLS